MIAGAAGLIKRSRSNRGKALLSYHRAQYKFCLYYFLASKVLSKVVCRHVLRHNNYMVNLIIHYAPNHTTAPLELLRTSDCDEAARMQSTFITLLTLASATHGYLWVEKRETTETAVTVTILYLTGFGMDADLEATRMFQKGLELRALVQGRKVGE